MGDDVTVNSDVLTNHEPVRLGQLEAVEQPLNLRGGTSLGTALERHPRARLEQLVDERVVQRGRGVCRKKGEGVMC